MIETIILAGGYSSRFDENKMESLYLGKPLLYHTVKTFLEISDIVTIVTGHYDVEYLLPYFENDTLRIVRNDSYQLGMFSSVKKGVEHVKNDFFLIPGDYPLVKVETLQILLKGTKSIRVPRFNGRKGHPIFIKKELIKPLLKEPSTSNLKVFRDRYDVEYIDVVDEGVLLDIDSKKDLENIVQKERVE